MKFAVGQTVNSHELLIAVGFLLLNLHVLTEAEGMLATRLLVPTLFSYI